MKILHYIPTYAPAWVFGGPVRSVSALCEGLVAIGVEVDVLTTSAGIKPEEGIPFNTPVDRNGVRVLYCETAPGIGINSPCLEDSVRREVDRYDLVHVTGVWQRTATAGCRASRKAGIPYVVSPRGALSRYSWAAGRLKKALYYLLAERANIHDASGVHYTSDMECRECVRYGLHGATAVIPNGLDFSFWDRDETGGQKWRSGLEIPREAPVALYSGRIHNKKNLDFLLPVLRELPDWHLVAAGFDEGGEAGRWLQRAERAGVANRILLTGPLEREKLRAAYSGSTAFVLPSHHENFANSALEAAACGCPIFLSTEVGVGLELGKIANVKVLPFEHSLWAAALNGVRDLNLPSCGSRNALDLTFSREATARQMAGFYRAILNGGDR